MTKGEYLLNKADECVTKSMEVTDGNLKTFFYNCSLGFKLRLSKMTIEELEEEVNE